jgi:hypothetical protein
MTEPVAQDFLIKAAPERYTLGIVYEPDVLDTDQEFADAATIRKAAFDFARRLHPTHRLTKAAAALLEAMRTAAAQPGEHQVDITEWLEAVDKGLLGDAHRAWDDDLGEIVETYVAPADLVVNGHAVRKGSWLLGVVWSPAMFAKIQAGERIGLSMGGVAQREAA